jgi:hypothetical protein
LEGPVSSRFIVRVALISLLTILAAKWAGRQFGIAPLAEL